MKYLGEEIEKKVETKRPIEYIRCDECKKKILPKKNSFFGSDIGTDYYLVTMTDCLGESQTTDLCRECCAKFTKERIEKNWCYEMNIEHRNLYTNELVDYDERCDELSSNDKEEE